MEDQIEPDDLEKLWSDFFYDLLDEAQRRAVLTRVASDVNAAIARGAESANLLETLDQVFRQWPLTDDMWPVAERAFAIAYGDTTARLIGWLIDDLGRLDERLHEIAPMLEVRSERLLREILARHAENLSWSAYAWNYSSQEWRLININMVQSPDGRSYIMRLKLTKVNGEILIFESRTNQLLLFIRAILERLNEVPSTAFTAPDIVETFLKETRHIVDTLSDTASGKPTVVGATDGLIPDETPVLPIDDKAES